MRCKPKDADRAQVNGDLDCAAVCCVKASKLGTRAGDDWPWGYTTKAHHQLTVVGPGAQRICFATIAPAPHGTTRVPVFFTSQTKLTVLRPLACLKNLVCKSSFGLNPSSSESSVNLSGICFSKSPDIRHEKCVHDHQNMF